MDAIIMPSTLSLLPKLIQDYPQLSFATGNRYAWSPVAHTVFYDVSDPQNVNLLLHELAHGLLGHHDYSKDVELIAMETEAWDKALELATLYKVTITDETIQDTLDTYREWLHARSSCPTCEATGYQSSKNEYTCVACTHIWRVNEARLCALRRYSTT
jgi:hypothetical protein